MSTRALWKTPTSPGLTSINQLLSWTGRRGAEPALCAKRAGVWQTVGAADLYRQARGVAEELGRCLAPGARVAILAESRPEWLIADFGCLAAGVVDVAIYPTLTAEQVAYILADSGASGIFVSSREQAEKILPVLATLPELRWLCCLDGPTGLALPLQELEWRALTNGASGTDLAEAHFAARLEGTPPEQVATLLYTSGTTGVPKGVILTHGNLCANLNTSTMDFHFERQERRLSILPLSHITERHIAYVDLLFDCVTYFAESMERVPANLVEVRPTFLVSVPRLFEKMAAAVKAQAARSPLKRRMLRWAQGVGLRMGPHWQSAAAVGPGLRMQAWMADRLVYRKLRARMGGCLTKIISGGAPLGRDLGEFLLSLGVVVDEGYGLTETSPVVAVNRPGGRRLGSIGRPLANVEVAFAADGELLVRGPAVFRGYWRREAESREALREGWFHTGDIGRQDSDGFLYITDRKKDLIKTSGGKFIAPQPIEAQLKASPLVAEAVVVGDGRPYAVALLVPNWAALEDVMAQRGFPCADRAEACGHAGVRALFQEAVDTVNAALARFETLKRFALLEQEFTVQSGELTPTIKVRRRAVEANHRAAIEALYESTVPPNGDARDPRSTRVP